MTPCPGWLWRFRSQSVCKTRMRRGPGHPIPGAARCSAWRSSTPSVHNFRWRTPANVPVFTFRTIGPTLCRGRNEISYRVLVARKRGLAILASPLPALRIGFRSDLIRPTLSIAAGSACILVPGGTGAGDPARFGGLPFSASKRFDRGHTLDSLGCRRLGNGWRPSGRSGRFQEAEPPALSRPERRRPRT